MKKLLIHANIRRYLELLNLGVGVLLIAISVVYLADGEKESFASWFIFGCMYMVMDKYWPSEEYSQSRIKVDRFKYFVNIVAFAVSGWFLVYLLV